MFAQSKEIGYVFVKTRVQYISRIIRSTELFVTVEIKINRLEGLQGQEKKNFSALEQTTDQVELENIATESIGYG
jgi:ribosomal 50S subunit-associated protein YjgA (DUF615 family)